MPDLINPIEMYLKAALELHEIGAPIRRTRIAERLEQSGPTVTKTVRRMQRDGLVLFSDENKKLTLSPTGFSAAVRVMRKHRIAEVFLERVVGLEWHLLHEEACRWEHVMSDRVTSLMDDLTGHPARSPYGNPIPPADPVDWDFTADILRVHSLAELTASANHEQEAVIDRIGETVQTAPALLAGLRDAGLVPGARVFATARNRTVLAHTSDPANSVELTATVAGQLFVRS